MLGIIVRRFLPLTLLFGLPNGTQAASEDSRLSWQIEIASDPSQPLPRQTRLADVSKGLTARGVKNQILSGKVTASGINSASALQQLLFSKDSGRLEILDSPTDIDVDIPKDNQGLVLDLQYNPSTGYQWDIADKGINSISVSDEAPDTPSRTLGAPAVRHLRVKTKGSIGTARLSYRRPFESSLPKTRLALRVIQSGGDGHIRLVDPEIDALPDTTPNAGATGGISPLPGSTFSARALAAVPSSYDARSLNLIPNTIRDQKACGSCWAFATVGVQEVAVIKAGLQASGSVDLSEQFLVSCNKEGYNCNGGWWAHHYHVGNLANNQVFVGAVNESDLPYSASNGTCQAIQKHPIRSGSWGSVAPVANSIGATADIQNAIMTYGAVATSVCVDSGWYSYGSSSGVYSPTTNACNGSVNHAVLLVGWDDSTQSWLLRNSWGPGWGNNGYMQIKYDPNGQNSRVGFASTWVSAAANTLSVSVTGSGSVTSTPTGISCTTNCNTSFGPGTSVSLTATPASGAQFLGWSGACAGTVSPCAINMANPALVTANFSLPSFALTVAKSGNGSVTSAPAGIDCGTSCSATYTSGSTITLTATPATGYLFSGWSGCTTSSGTTCSVTVSAARTVTATFAPSSFALNVSKTGSGSVVSNPAGIDCGATCSGNFSNGSIVTLTATPTTGSVVSGWTGCTSFSGASCSVTMNAAKSVSATFASSSFPLNVSKTGSGSITSNPAGIDCGLTCSGNFSNGSIVTLTATPTTGSVVSGWTGCTSFSGASCSVTMNAAKSVSATFASSSFPLNVSKTGSGSITSNPAGIDCGSTCSGNFSNGSIVTLTATPTTGYVVSGWTGCTSLSGASCSVTMNAAKSVSATFASSSFALNVSKTGSGSVISNPAGIDCGLTCSGNFSNGSIVTLTATPTTGYAVAGWTGCTSSSGTTCSVSLSGSKSVTVNFVTASYVLNVLSSRGGSVSSSPVGINCGTSCQYAFASGTRVTLSATPSARKQFVGWTGACSGTGICSLSMTATTTVGAIFR